MLAVQPDKDKYILGKLTKLEPPVTKPSGALTSEHGRRLQVSMQEKAAHLMTACVQRNCSPGKGKDLLDLLQHGAGFGVGAAC